MYVHVYCINKTSWNLQGVIMTMTNKNKRRVDEPILRVNARYDITYLTENDYDWKGAINNKRKTGVV